MVTAEQPLATTEAMAAVAAKPVWNKRSKIVAATAGISVVMLISLLSFCGKGGGTAGGGGGGDARTEPVSFASVHASEIFSEYVKNPIAAKQKYKGKYVEITGKTSGVTQASDGTYTVGFVLVLQVMVDNREYNSMSPRQKKWYNEGYPPNLVAKISAKNEAGFANVKKDDTITILAMPMEVVPFPEILDGKILKLEDARWVKTELVAAGKN